MAASIEAGHNVGVVWDVVAVFACLEGLNEDDVGFTVIGKHEVLVAAAGADQEASCVVSVERADRFHPEVDLFGRGRCERVLNGGSRRGGEVGVVGLG